nr:hypothetical protein [Pseudomonas carnis]
MTTTVAMISSEDYMTQLNQPSPYHRHVDYEAGHIVHANPVTGEVIAQSAMVRARNPEEKYQAWAAERRADDLLVSDHSSTATYEPAPVAPDVGAPKSAKAGRGRPKTSFANPVAAYMYLLAVPDLLPWVDHIITGSIITSAGVTNGKINVKARAVIGALFATEITAEACKTGEISLRTAQRIAKAARHAAHGIASYVERHPSIKAELDSEALFRAFQT